MQNYELYYRRPHGSVALEEVESSGPGLEAWAIWKPGTSIEDAQKALGDDAPYRPEKKYNQIKV